MEKKEKKKKRTETKKSKRNLRCELTDAELLASGKELAEKTSALRVLADDAKRSAADFKAKVTAAESEISVLSNRVNTGYEFRIVTCTERFDTPRVGKKKITRDDTKELIGVEDMTQSEMQRELNIVPLAEQPAQPKKEDEPTL